MEQLVARRAHNPKVVSSSLAPATKNSKLEFLLESDPFYLTKQTNVPTITISALDDFCFPGVITEESTNLPYENKNITMVITNHGGHISFIDYGATISWSSRVAIEHIRCKLTYL